MKQKSAKRQVLGASPDKVLWDDSRQSPIEEDQHRPNKSLSPSRGLRLAPQGPNTAMSKVSSKLTATTDNLIRKDNKTSDFSTGYTRELRKTCRGIEERYMGGNLGINPKPNTSKMKKTDPAPKLRMSNIDKADRLVMQPVSTKHRESKKSSAVDLREDKDRDLAQYIATQQMRLMGDSNKHFEKINDFQNKRMKVLGGKTTQYMNSIKKASESASPTMKQANTIQIDHEKSPKIKLRILDDMDNESSHPSLLSKNQEAGASHDEISDKVPCPTNRGLNTVIYSGTPKSGIVSERCKKNKRSPTLTDSLNLTVIQGLRPKEPPAGPPPKQDKQKENDKATVKKDYEINDMYKIIQFLGKDKNLQSGKLELKEKLKRFRNDFKQSDVVLDDQDDHIDHIDIKITIGKRGLNRHGFIRGRQVRYR